MDYSDLRNKTIFDFCDDAEILNEIAPYQTRERHEELCKTTLHVRWASLYEYAEIINDENMKNEINRVFNDDIEAFYNE